MSVKISDYNLLCNLGCDIKSAYKKALLGDFEHFQLRDDIIKGKAVRLGIIDFLGDEINNQDYNLRCNKLILKCLEGLDVKGVMGKYGTENVGLVVVTTNSGTMEYEKSKNPKHAEFSNPAEFVKSYFGLKNFFTTVSTACSSGIKAFSTARRLIETGYSKAVIVIGVDSLSGVPVFGFDSLEILSNEKTNPMSKNRRGINIGEGVAAFILEEEGEFEIAGIGETTDFYHPTTPEPGGAEAIKAIEQALSEAEILPYDIDYINLHGTGTGANDLMEANAVYKIFQNKVCASSTKPLTGHCLGAAASVEIALCLELLKNKELRPFPHIYDGEYDPNLPEIWLADHNTRVQKMETILCTSFGFGGANTAVVLRRAK